MGEVAINLGLVSALLLTLAIYRRVSEKHPTKRFR